MAFKRLTIIFLFTCISTQFFGQQKTLIDSSFQYLSDKYYEFKPTDLVKSKLYADVYFKKTLKKKDTIRITTAHLYKSHLLKNDSIYINYLDSLISITQFNPTKNFPAIAYEKKGKFFLTKGHRQKSLSEYLKVLEYTEKVKNDSLKYISKQRIGILKSYAKDYYEANKLYREVLNFYKKRKHDPYLLNSLLVNISMNYKLQGKYDSATYFNKKSYSYASEKKLYDVIGYNAYTQGQIEFAKKNYQTAIDSLKTSIKTIINDENYTMLPSLYRTIGKSYYELNDKNNLLKYCLLVDSICDSRKLTHSSQRFAYSILIKHFKENKDLHNQLKYIEKLLNAEEILNERTKKLDKTFYEEYDKPKLIAEKDRVIKELKSKSNATIYSLLGVSGIVLFLFGYQYRKRKHLKLRFEEIVKNKEKQDIVNITHEPKEDLSIPKEVIEKVLEGLESFEKGTTFTSPKLSLHSLANDLNTNANYLSKIINHYKGFGFSTYINNLRVNHVIQLLDTDSKIRKYSIKGIAEEMGYNNAESFSKAFYKKTGLKPSYYIKQLGKLEG
tara:strand:+ start:17957 stop:19621 length:1665 start_codon:yes stop_codon:yes gene_type:complete